MKKLLMLSVTMIALGCAGAPRTEAARYASNRQAPAEAFEACDRRAPGETCTVKFDDVEASGTCAPPPASIRDRRLICTT